MSFRPAARQFFERRGAPTPPLPYDAEVEYLESTGMQWIDTGIVGSGSLEISCKFKKSDTTTGTSRTVYGAYVNSANIVGLGGVNASWFTWNAVSLSRNTNVPADTEWHNTIMSTVVENKYVSFDGTVTATYSGTSSIAGTMPIILFGRNPNSASGTKTLTPCSIASFSIKDFTTNQLLIDLIPVRFTNELHESEGAMYDRVTGALFRNAGTGAFLWAEKQ